MNLKAITYMLFIAIFFWLGLLLGIKGANIIAAMMPGLHPILTIMLKLVIVLVVFKSFLDIGSELGNKFINHFYNN